MPTCSSQSEDVLWNSVSLQANLCVVGGGFVWQCARAIAAAR